MKLKEFEQHLNKILAIKIPEQDRDDIKGDILMKYVKSNLSEESIDQNYIFQMVCNSYKDLGRYRLRRVFTVPFSNEDSDFDIESAAQLIDKSSSSAFREVELLVDLKDFWRTLNRDEIDFIEYSLKKTSSSVLARKYNCTRATMLKRLGRVKMKLKENPELLRVLGSVELC